MNVVKVIPLIRGTHVEALSYYTNQDVPLGSVICVPIRKKNQPAIVIDTVPASATKAALRAATFTLRKLPEQTVTATIPESVVELARALEATVPAECGAILFSLLPKEVREGHMLTTHRTTATPEQTISETAVLIGTFEDRFRAYRSRIRETFAHRGSVLFVVPTVADIERAKNHLERGIEKRVITFSTAFTKKKLASAYEQFADMTHAKLIITTPGHAFLDRHDITDVIIDQSRSRAYKSRFRPYLDLRDALKQHAKITGRNVLVGDMVPRAEDEWHRREDFYATEGEAPNRLTLPSTLEVIAAPQEKSGAFELFLPPVMDELQAITEKRKNIFIYAARRGIAPVVACVDCGHVLRCPDSGAPFTLFKTNHNGEEQRWFVSAASGRRLRAADTCPNCNSWRLRERGIGIQHIEEMLKKNLPQVPLLVFDHTTASTPRKAARIISEFYDTKGAILLGTAMALPHLTSPVPYSVITSLDAARAIPTWRSEEELFALILALREKTTETCYLQTRSEPDEVIQLAANGHLEQFFTDELTLREQLGYPPYTHLIHVTLQGSDAAVAQLEKQVAATLHKWQPHFYSAPTSIREKTIRYGLMRVPRSSWPNPELMAALRALPPVVRVEINPDRIV